LLTEGVRQPFFSVPDRSGNRGARRMDGPGIGRKIAGRGDGLRVLLCSDPSNALKKHYRKEREKRLTPFRMKSYRLKSVKQSGIPRVPGIDGVFSD